MIVLQFSTPALSEANWASGLVRFLGHSDFSHVDFVLSDGNLLGASDQGPTGVVVSGNPQGVAVRPPNYQIWGMRRRMTLDTDADTASSVIAAAMSQLGKPFDGSGINVFLSVMQFGLGDTPAVRDWRKPDSWWCSELGAWSLEDGGFFSRPLQWPKDRVSPTDLILVNLMDSRWANPGSFWAPVPGLTLDPGER